MVEPLAVLSKLCQKPNYKKVGNWYVRHIVRDAALPATWLLLHTKITANQVTVFSLAASFVGITFLAVPGPLAFLIGALFLQFWYYLDHVDGQIARYRKTVSLTGRFLDFMTHHIVHTALFFAMGFYGYAITGRIIFVVLGFFASLSILVFNLIHDVKYKTFFEKFEKDGGCITAQKVAPVQSSQEAVSVSKRTFSLVHKLCEIHVVMNILTFSAVCQLAVCWLDFRFVIFLLYAVLVPLIAVGKVSYILKTRKIDEEYQKLIAGGISKSSSSTKAHT